MSPSHSVNDNWLIADIGGTHARLVTWSASAGLDRVERFANDDYPALHTLIADYVQRAGCRARRAALAVAMPISSDSVVLTNRAWRVSPAELRAQLGWDEVRLVNDFAAAAAGVESLPTSAFTAVCGSDSVGAAPRLVVGPGTGLGAAVVLATLPPLVVSSEAGHMTFAPVDPSAQQLLAAARSHWGRTSWERILCGSGLAWIDAVERGADAMLPAEVSARALQGEPRAVSATARFSRLLGEFAGDVCLAFAAFGAVTLCGGVLDGLGAAFDRAEFAAGFIDKGRFSARLARVPCRRIGGDDIGLLGLAHYLAGRCELSALRAVT